MVDHSHREFDVIREKSLMLLNVRIFVFENNTLN